MLTFSPGTPPDLRPDPRFGWAGGTLHRGGKPTKNGENVGVPRKRLDRKLLLASLVIASGIVLVVVGLTRSVTGRDQQRLPDAIESVDPIRGATQIVQQSSVFVDLQTGYEAVMVLNGVELPMVNLDGTGTGELPKPGDQVALPAAAILEPGNNTITYTPVEGGPVEALDTGLNTAEVIYWKTNEGRTRARSYTWTFTVV